jgi:hypothetical protein
MNPASVRGQFGHAVAIFHEDANGDLVEIEYLCSPCASGDSRTYNALWWPAFDFGEPLTTFCKNCTRRID